jgi:uncharacterized protein (DUF1778 family)
MSVATRAQPLTKSKVKPAETPLCIRFKVGELAHVHRAAALENMTRSQWVREIVFKRAEQVLGNMKREGLVFDTAHGNGEQICIRFKPDEYLRILRAAAKENAVISPWIRACVTKEIGRDPRNDKKSKYRTSSTKPAKSSSSASPRVRVKKRFDSGVRLVGEPPSAPPEGSGGDREPT